MSTEVSQNAALASNKAQQSELLALQQQVNRLKHDLTPGKTGQQKLRKACNDFEAVFISKMWEQMRNTIPKGGMLHSPQEDMYRSMFDREFSEKLASDGGIGMGDMLYNQLKDKLKNTSKITGKEGLGTRASAADAAVTTSGSTAGLFTTTSTLKPTGDKKIDTGSLTQRAFSAPQRPMGSRYAGQGGGQDSSAPSRPASVAGDVMPDVEALARRIEADYDHKLAVNGEKPQQSQTDASAAHGASTGYGQDAGAAVTDVRGAQSALNRVGGYGRAGVASRGRKLAVVG
jgi:flagellar protein FlgJ